MVQYEEMSSFYDQLTMDQPYETWLDIVTQFSNQKHSILDLGCGTGSFTTLLNQFDHVTGMDLSVDMLAVAREKSNAVNWIEGDMTDFDLQQQFDAITIFCDSLNYLGETEDVQQTFERVFHHLKDDGVFMFDVHTLYKMSTLFNDQCYIDETDQVFLAWEAVKGEEPDSVWHDMSFFVAQADGTYRRFDESHYQRTYAEDDYKQMLLQAGFKHIETFVDFDVQNHSDKGHRLFFIVTK
ncbi:ubiquinone/menaquinone biosynthesis C-methylase UbiE [Staphylococcus auricularis]|uniref:Class I SAM-dependent methyltransferase n=1 Tax=Staphylococcus auricularis TaxID=29379 RepID=A0AAP8PMV1_9STAP|nr:class I SAM-dependent methyltransferase [Staphylococcus auricularis]MBM0868007.1 class I SAM-dependent methyltransferase [Staphylococcus auricularis]MCG7340994.1 class I SAM-dependent methyltransferase [Staphylococcus auricularis]PNZ66099.1 class I SAM-dependent methyltransferase [Staphylococcus auricularis]QPT05186.1 class I SAM-dependent methyltransferase [Staphylococcus auricularis]SQJ12051.1 methyltransferase [Staphylococcus auricularis]